MGYVHLCVTPKLVRVPGREKYDDRRSFNGVKIESCKETNQGNYTLSSSQVSAEAQDQMAKN